MILFTTDFFSVNTKHCVTMKKTGKEQYVTKQIRSTYATGAITLSCSRVRIRSVVHNLDAATLTLEITQILWVPAQKGSFGCNIDSILGPFSNSFSRDCQNICNFWLKCLWGYQETAPTSHSAGTFFSDKHGMPLNCICQNFSGFLYTKHQIKHRDMYIWERFFSDPCVKPLSC